MNNELFSKEYGIVKFVKVNGEYRFTSNYGNHSDLVKEGETASSAGFIKYSDGSMYVTSESSMTLKWLGPDEEDGSNIASLIGMKLKRECKLCGLHTTNDTQICFGCRIDSDLFIVASFNHD